MHITIPSSTNDDRNPHWYLLYTYRSAVLVVLVLHIYGEWLQTQSLLISFFHLDSFSPLDLNLRSSSNDVHRDPLGLSLLRKEALYPPRALFAQIHLSAAAAAADPIPPDYDNNDDVITTLIDYFTISSPLGTSCCHHGTTHDFHNTAYHTNQ